MRRRRLIQGVLPLGSGAGQAGDHHGQFKGEGRLRGQERNPEQH
jgi:hypothetical protein